jgi:hypothetical protein
MDAVDEHTWRAVKYTLETLGKDRGYTTQRRPPVSTGSDDAEHDYEARLLMVYGSPRSEAEKDGNPPPRTNSSDIFGSETVSLAQATAHPLNPFKESYYGIILPGANRWDTL